MPWEIQFLHFPTSATHPGDKSKLIELILVLSEFVIPVVFDLLL